MSALAIIIITASAALVGLIVGTVIGASLPHQPDDE